ncbi:MAG TPA: 2-nitropropane dioxygenase [Elusimicrobia bacterium]|nr:MAG: hypothetical protein A2016_04875 [Elusimicrobia bacterium GWF2_62_30]HBA60571.1 2-nitropropane dioxygenase [Elusimicrobiota bacterium]
MSEQNDPAIITGGMGIWISCWVMSRIVSMMGGIGTVSGTALDVVYARILQDGDPGGHVRRAFAELIRRQPGLSGAVGRILKEYFIEGGKPQGAQYKATPTAKLDRVRNAATGKKSFWEPGMDFQVLTLAANFAEVWLAKEGHKGSVAINYLRKVERPLPWGLYGAMLAGVDYVAIGAGSPSDIPGMIRKLCRHEDAEMPIRVFGTDSSSGDFSLCLRPGFLGTRGSAPLLQPKFLAIVSSFLLANALASNVEARPYGFIIEGAVAGGHNAPPGKKAFNNRGEPLVIYTDADAIDVKAIAGLGLPFWLAGAYGGPEKLKEALELGATGIQFGTMAALSGQSGLAAELREQALELLMRGELNIRTDGRASPSGFPFKVAEIPGTLSEEAVYSVRKRICDIGFLQSAYLKPDGDLAFRCPAENEAEYVRKGGKAAHTKGRVCLCNGLLATAGFPQTWPSGYKEPPIVTLGDDLSHTKILMKTLPAGQKTYSIGKALKYVASPLKCAPKDAA